jgi:tRNA threonylcarbamoyl adenosine modification protein YjeE
MGRDSVDRIEVRVETHSVAEARQLAKTLIAGLGERADAWQRAVVIALDGPLGAGKTEFTKGLGAAIGIDPTTICSATFVIICEYDAAANEKTLIHVDAYRLGGGAELDDIGFGEMLMRPRTLIAIEWASRVAEILPPETLWIDQTATSPTDRIVTLSARTDSLWADVLGQQQ